MAKKQSMSGFPEWLPREREVERQVIATVEQVYSLHGFSSLETRAVESVETLLTKGEIDKEVYGVSRLQDPEAAAAKLALTFDLTVPFARYIVENAGKLDFPFRRYQIQKVWRGERPQEGRFREFRQADIDIVDVDTLPTHYDAEILMVLSEAYTKLVALGLPQIMLRVNNRKVCEGFYRGVGLEEPTQVLRLVDKLDKIGADKVLHLLKDRLGATQKQAEKCLALATIVGSRNDVVKAVRDLDVKHDLLEEGLDELDQVLALAEHGDGGIVADLSIARGLDYYTGTVFESSMLGFEHVGSVGSGGRYDKLASDGKKTYPGVGGSLGITRTLSVLFGKGLTASRSVPTTVLVALADEEHRAQAVHTATQLRARGISTLVAPSAEKFGKQIKFADRRGIPFVWFTNDDGNQVKDIRSGEQVSADPEVWAPLPRDLTAEVAFSEDS